MSLLEAIPTGVTESEGLEGRVLALLRKDHRIDTDDLTRACELAERAAESVITVLPRLGVTSDGELAEAISRALELPLLNQDDIPHAPVLSERLGHAFLATNRVLPLRLSDDVIHVAVANPCFTRPLEAIRFATGLDVHLHIAPPRVIEEAIERLYGASGSSLAAVAREIGEDRSGGAEGDFDRLKDLTSDAPTIRFINAIIDHAVEARASDIHLEPYENGLKVRLRIDGVLREIEKAPAEGTAAILSRLKVMAHLNIAERRMPQDGRMRLPVRGRLMDFRVATTPSVHGESIVVRILDSSASRLTDTRLGFEPAALEAFRTLLKKPNGIVLVTGPTGSGKTTTLYAALNALNDRTRKILTIEDPVEYMMEGVVQLHVKPDIGLTFAPALRSFLRQDPDIMMVGEIRDQETGQVAAQAALTGHLVLSTLHTNDAASAVTRLLDLGVEDFLVASTLNGVVAQRLVRRLCAACRRLVGSEARPACDAVGCQACDGTGFRGRMAIAEVLLISDNVRMLIKKGIQAQAILRAAREEGMTTMYDDGLVKVARGETTLAEVQRATAET